MKHGIRVLFVLGFFGFTGCKKAQEVSIPVEGVETFSTLKNKWVETKDYQVSVIGTFTDNCMESTCNSLLVQVTDDFSDEYNYLFPLRPAMEIGKSLKNIKIEAFGKPGIFLLGSIGWKMNGTWFDHMPELNQIESIVESFKISGTLDIFFNYSSYLRIKINTKLKH